jgi:hypothetical protein
MKMRNNFVTYNFQQSNKNTMFCLLTHSKKILLMILIWKAFESAEFGLRINLWSLCSLARVNAENVLRLHDIMLVK